MKNYGNDLIRWGRLVWAIQMFYGVLLSDNEMIKNNYFVLNVQEYLGKYIDFEAFQHKIIENWKNEIPDRNILLEDVTCYEVYIRFPTDLERRCGQTYLRILRMVMGKANSCFL